MIQQTEDKFKIYIAGPFAEKKHRKALLHMIDIIKHDRDLDKFELYIPMDFKVKEDYQNPDGSWHLPNHVWAKKVFDSDIKHLNEADLVVALYDGRKGTTGTAWEIGHAFAKGTPVVAYIPEYAKKSPMSLMVVNSLFGVLLENGTVDQSGYLAPLDQK